MPHPCVSLNGDIVVKPFCQVGEWVRLEFWLPVIDEEDKAGVWRWWLNFDRDDLLKEGGALKYALDGVRERFLTTLGPAAYTRLVEKIKLTLEGRDLLALMPPHIPEPLSYQTRRIQ